VRRGISIISAWFIKSPESRTVLFLLGCSTRFLLVFKFAVTNQIVRGEFVEKGVMPSHEGDLSGGFTLPPSFAP
jgi:hypothetical protein